LKLSNWLTCKPKLLELGFTEEEIDTAMEKSKLAESDLTDLAVDKPRYHNGLHEEVTPPQTTKEMHSRDCMLEGKMWQATRWETGPAIRIPARYQGLRHNRVLVPLLLARCPGLSDFKLDVYEMHSYGDCHEFYVRYLPGINTSDKHDEAQVYVPYRAVTDPKQARELISARMMFAHKHWPLAGYDTPESKELLDKVVNALQGVTNG